MEQSKDIHCLSPAELRLLCRNADPRISTTSGLANGYQQANVTMLPSSLAKDFEAFCQRNAAPLPLIYRSQPGETLCPAVALGADVRTDIPRYCVYEDGRVVKTVSSLQEYSSEFRDMVCFYLGCSFGFEGKLKDAGVPVRNVEQKRNVSMYRTSVPCVPAGVFQCPLVVTMRPIPAEMLDTVVEITHLNPLAHGAPVHIGDPALLGIQDLSRPEYGDAVEQQPGDVPTFWACAVTSIEAVFSSKPSLAFSHSPGCMFLTDLPDSTSSSPMAVSHQSEDPELIPLCFKLSHTPLLYSLASKRAVAKIRQLETIIENHSGDRLTQPSAVGDELVRCCLALSHAASVAVVTDNLSSLRDEAGGPSGAIAMVNMLLSLGKQVTMVTDRTTLETNRDVIDEAVRSGLLAAVVPLVPSEDDGPDSALLLSRQNRDVGKLRYDHLVTIEHTEQAADVQYNKVRESAHLVNPTDKLLNTAKDTPGISTSGVSNWGGYAVACGLYLLQTCPSHQRYLKKGLGLNQTVSKEELQKLTSGLTTVVSMAMKEDDSSSHCFLNSFLDYCKSL